MRPAFELDQIRRYIAYLQQYPSQLNGTVESHLFPVLQRIFFREGMEVRNFQTVHEKQFPFLLIDLDLRKPEVCVDFAYQSQSEKKESTVPKFALEWADRGKNGEFRERLLILRDYPCLRRSTGCSLRIKATSRSWTSTRSRNTRRRSSNRT